MKLLEAHPHFSPFTDPVSGVTSYLLDEVVAPIQQSFYFVSPSLTRDERWLWVHCAWPPAPHKTLALISLNPENPTVRAFPQAQFTTAHPLITSDGNVLFGVGASLYRMDMDGETECVFTLPDDIIRDRKLVRLASHVSLSADGGQVLIDGAFYNSWFVGTADLKTGRFNLVRKFEEHHNHAHFSPVDPDVFIIARDKFSDPGTGEFHHHTKRTFVMNRGGSQYECINSEHKCAPFRGACHEWWSPDGRICYIDYENGAYEFNPVTGETVHVWQEPLCHAHCSSDRRYWCADESPYKWREQPCKVLLFDRLTESRTEIQSAMPMPGGDYWATRTTYHIDPHPQFSPKDNFVVYTATIGGRATVALAPLPV